MLVDEVARLLRVALDARDAGVRKARLARALAEAKEDGGHALEAARYFVREALRSCVALIDGGAFVEAQHARVAWMECAKVTEDAAKAVFNATPCLGDWAEDETRKVGQ